MPKLKQQFHFKCWLSQSLPLLQHLSNCEEIPEYLLVAGGVLLTSCSDVCFLPLVPEHTLLLGLSSIQGAQERALGFISVLLPILDWNCCCLLLLHGSTFLNVERWHLTLHSGALLTFRSRYPSGFWGVSFLCFCLFFSNWNLLLFEYWEWNFNC